MTVARTEKQAAIVAAVERSPSASDTAIAKQVGCSRSLVRRIRDRIAGASAGGEAAAPPARSVPWRRALDPVFEPDGFADELEGFVEELVTLGGRLDHRLSQMEIQARAHHLRHDRHRFVRAIYALARQLQRELVPVGPCPFCESGCSRCTGGGWANETTVDAGALLEDIHAKARWWRSHRVQVPV